MISKKPSAVSASAGLSWLSRRVPWTAERSRPLSQRPKPGSRRPRDARAATQQMTPRTTKVPRQVRSAGPVSRNTSSGDAIVPAMKKLWYRDSTRTRTDGGYVSVSSGWCTARTDPLVIPSATSSTVRVSRPPTNPVARVMTLHPMPVVIATTARRGRFSTAQAMGRAASVSASADSETTVPAQGLAERRRRLVARDSEGLAAGALQTSGDGGNLVDGRIGRGGGVDAHVLTSNSV